MAARKKPAPKSDGRLPLQHDGVFLDFGGHSYVTVGALKGLQSGQFMITFWMKWREPEAGDAAYVEEPGSKPYVKTSARDATLFSVNRAQDESMSRGGTRFSVENLKNLTLSVVGSRQYKTGLNVADGDWHHIAIHMTWNPRGRGYKTVVSIDGGANPSQGWRGDVRMEQPFKAGAALRIGGRYFDTEDAEGGFVGSMAQFQIANGQRDSNEVRRSMFTELPRPVRGIILNLRLTRDSFQPGQKPDAAGKQRVSTGHIGWRETDWIRWKKVDFRIFDLRRAYLRNAVLTDARLANKDFTGADLAGAVFVKCDLTTARFGDALKGRHTQPGQRQTAFRNCRVPLQTLGKDWRNLDLSASVIVRPDGNLQKLDARDANLSRLDLTKCDLSEGRFGSAILDGTKLDGCVLTEADFSGASLERASLTGVVDAFDARFVEARFHGANLSNANLSDARFEKAWMGKDSKKTNATLVNALLTNADFSNARLSGANVSHAWCDGVKVGGAEMYEINFTGAYLKAADFSRGKLRNADFTDACLLDATFNGADLQPYDGVASKFVGAFLLGSDFTQALLDGAQFNDALLSAAKSDALTQCTIRSNDTRVHPKEFREHYGVSRLPEALTSDRNVCPDGRYGPCGGGTWKALDLPLRWIHQARRQRR